nr:MAG TPA: hypothetical protein [Caudoviricetes sp.]
MGFVVKLHIHNNYYLCVYTKFDKLLYFVILFRYNNI